ncbi:MAG: PDZ domain-containing protein [Planctomycetota bacterium]
MINQQALKLATAGVSLALVGMAVRPLVSPKAESLASTTKSRPVVEMGQLGIPDRRSANDDDADRSARRREPLTLRVGKIAPIPDRDEITSIDALPRSLSEVKRLYRGSLDRACRMVVEGAPVTPPVAPELVGQPGTLGRVSVLSIGLELDADGREKLPAVVRRQVIGYLGKHRLSVQPVVFHDDNNRVYFGTDCQAAFFEIQRPGLTVRPEPMIEDAVRRFRAIGLVDGTSSEPLPGSDFVNKMTLGRTLAMAFTFEQSNELVTDVDGAKKQSTEWMLLHMPAESTTSDYEVQVFVTKNDRTELHLLDTSHDPITSPLATISADVRFDRMILMGVYPAEPVVTDIRFRSMAFLPMSVVDRLMTPSEGFPGQSLTEVLDDFGKLHLQRDAVGEDTSEQTVWIDRVKEEKQIRIQRMVRGYKDNLRPRRERYGLPSEERDRSPEDDGIDPGQRYSAKPVMPLENSPQAVAILGLFVQPDEVLGYPGLRVERLLAQSRAQMAGLQRGDVIVKIRDVRVFSAADVPDALVDTAAGSVVEIQLFRGQEFYKTSIELIELDSPSADVTASRETSTQPFDESNASKTPTMI